MKKAFREFFIGVNEQFSSKRLITFISVLLMILAFVCDLFFGLSVPEWMFSNVVYIVISGLGFVASEQFGRDRNKDKTDNDGDSV